MRDELPGLELLVPARRHWSTTDQSWQGLTDGYGSLSFAPNALMSMCLTLGLQVHGADRQPRHMRCEARTVPDLGPTSVDIHLRAESHL